MESAQRVGQARITRASTGDLTPLLTFLAVIGFAHQSESTLKSIFAWCSWPQPEVSTDTCLTWQETLRLDLMHRCCPAMTESEAINAMHEASLLESPVAPFAAVLDAEIMRDVIIPGEHDMLETELATLHERVARSDSCARRVRQNLHHWTWSAAQPKPPSVVSQTKPPREYTGKPDDVDAMRVYLRTHGPSGTQVCADVRNGRIQVGYRGKDFQRLPDMVVGDASETHWRVASVAHGVEYKTDRLLCDSRVKTSVLSCQAAFAGSCSIDSPPNPHSSEDYGIRPPYGIDQQSTRCTLDALCNSEHCSKSKMSKN
eukprot:6236977-Amphidinium_carterae.2